ncbi:MAG: DNA translocase FtsK 4TM domain-containing protein [Salinibacter sp.]
MASSGSDTSDRPAPVLPTRRKMEVLGLVLMALGLLLSLAFLTYQPADDAVAQAAPLVDALLNPSEYPPVQNALGLLGAELARSLVPGFLGYSVLLFSGAMMVWGYAIFRHWALRPLLYPTGLTVLSAFVVACLVGWTAHAARTDLVRWAGAVGMGMAGWMQEVFGPAGSFILLLLAVAVMLLLVVDHDIQRTVDRVVEALRRIEAKLQSGAAAWRERRARAKAQSQVEARSREEASTDDAAGRPSAASATEGGDPDEDDEGTDRDRAAVSSDPDASAPTGTAQDSPRSPAPPAITIEVPESTGDGRPLRRNDLFRTRLQDASDADEEDASGDEMSLGALEQEFGEALDQTTEEVDPSSSSSAPDAASDPTESARDAPADAPPASESQAPPEQRPDPADAPAAEPDRSSPTGQDESSPAADDGSAPEDDVELTVKERVEEEKAEEIERPADTPETVEYESPPLDLLEEPTDRDPSVNRDELEKNKRILLDKLDTYNIEIQDISAVVGPTVTRYELTPAPGIKVSRIKSLEDDLAMAMAAPSVRMMAPIPGKSAVGVEIPNSSRELVRLREVLGTAKFRDTDMTLPIPMGKTIEGEVFLADLTTMPHLLIAGATGSGKSVGLNSLLTGLIYACHPMNLRFVIIDPKKIELQQYTALQTQFVAQPEDVDQTVITDIEEASGVLKSVEKEMEERYDLLSEANVRGIEGYNEKFKAGALSPEDGHRHMPYVVVVVDELADLMMSVGDDIEGPISRLAQMARAVGIHLVLATQRPSVDVITGVIKANFPSRIAYEVASMADSRTILDQGGAEGLVGNGDMLFLSGSDLRRLQGPFVKVEEVERVVDFVSEQPGVTPYTLPSLMDAGHGPTETLGVEDTDENFEEAARVTVRRQQGSVSLLQRKLAVGYTRAARIVDQLEEAGIVGPHNGTKAREVLVESEEELERLLKGEDVEGAD